MTIYPKQLVGIFMDHHQARIMDARSKASLTIHSKYESRLRAKGQSAVGTQLGNYRSTNNEANEHHQEQHDTIAYYKSIGEAILPYDEIYLFGPTTAKEEFQNFLLNDPHFREKIIRVEGADYISLNQQDAQVHRHFKSKL
jgi:hypothetical protein